MKSLSSLILLMALFGSTAMADGVMGTGGRGVNDTVRTNTVKGGFTAEDGDTPPPPPPPPCVPTATDSCDGVMGTGGRSNSVSVMLFVQKYLVTLFN